MNFRQFMENKTATPSRPYFRVVTKPMHGGKALEAGDPVAPGTYWTPRWDSVIRMCSSIFREYHRLQIMLRRYGESNKDPDWQTKVYKITNAEMGDPPKEHAWGFAYNVDAGEQILIKAHEPPQIIKDFHPEDDEFENFVLQPVPKIVDASTYKSAVMKGDKKLYLHPDYAAKCIIAYEKEDWEYIEVERMCSIPQYEKFMRQVKLIEPFDDDNGLAWAMNDFGWYEN